MSDEHAPDSEAADLMLLPIGNLSQDAFVAALHLLLDPVDLDEVEAEIRLRRSSVPKAG